MFTLAGVSASAPPFVISGMALVMPPVPAFYNRPRTIDDIVTSTVLRALDLFDLDLGLLRRWGEDIETRPPSAAGDEA